MSKETYYLKFGTRRRAMMTFIEKEDGTQIVVFHLHGGGLHITKHPLESNPHLRVPKKAFSQDLDLAALRRIDWASMEPEFKNAFESKFYWPEHRADLVAFPGPPGKTWHEGLTEVFRGPDIDVVEMFRWVLGYGTLYKVGYGDRKAFFTTNLGKGSPIWDKKDRRFTFWVGVPFAERPLFGLRVDDGPFIFRMPEPLEQWQATMNYEMKIGAEEFFEARAHEFEKDFEAIMPELEEFVRGFRIVRWKPGDREQRKAPDGQPGGDHGGMLVGRVSRRDLSSRGLPSENDGDLSSSTSSPMV